MLRLSLQQYAHNLAIDSVEENVLRLITEGTPACSTLLWRKKTEMSLQNERILPLAHLRLQRRTLQEMQEALLDSTRSCIAPTRGIVSMLGLSVHHRCCDWRLCKPHAPMSPQYKAFDNAIKSSTDPGHLRCESGPEETVLQWLIWRPRA